jgi:alkanesulfonate monooxygenase SsuD/methylene tetrahydromethanopterin reductase-like flavin-dependent oxidoreductase (luciferase family)
MTSTTRIGVSLVCDDIRELAGLAKAAEGAGVSVIGVSDSPCLYPETYVQATVVATATNRVLLGPRVTNPVTRHPSVAGSAMVAVDQLSEGRAVFGIGVGDSAVHSIGSPSATLAELREYVLALKDAFATGEGVYRGMSFRLRGIERRIPIYLAASGPRGLALAGEIADGVIIGCGVNEQLVPWALGHLAQGAAKAGRSVEDIDVWWLLGASIAATDTAAREAIRPFLASVANASFRGALTGKGLPAELEGAMGRLVERYDFGEHALSGPTRRNGLLVEELGLTSYLLDRFALAGTFETFTSQIERAARIGAEQLWFTMPLPDKIGFLRTLQHQVMPYVSG